MGKPRIYITRKIPDHLLGPYKEQFDFHLWEKEEEAVPREILKKEASQAEGLLCVLTDKIDEDLLQGAPNLKMAANMAVGYDNIDIPAAKKYGVTVTNTPDVLTETTADMGLALLMTTARRMIEANQNIKKDQWKNWSPYLLAGTDVHHKTMGIAGMGRIGQAIARRAKGFGMSVMYYNRSRKPDAEQELGAEYAAFDTLLKEADFVISVLPMTDETKKMFNAAAFQKMKSSAIFVNISRGGVVNETELAEAIKDKQIRGAGLDVFENEPISADHPFMQHEEIVCMPHIGSATEETRSAMLKLCLENIDGFFSGNGAKTPVKD
ncbi:2-hydroxyacid dehydrogenase [Virgibacillus oceani]